MTRSSLPGKGRKMGKVKERFTSDQIEMVMEEMGELRELAERIGADQITMGISANEQSTAIYFNDGDLLVIDVSDDGDSISQNYIRKLV